MFHYATDYKIRLLMVKRRNNMKDIFKKIARILAIILVGASFARDIIWANTEMMDSHQSSSTLQIPSFLQNPDPERMVEVNLKHLLAHEFTAINQTHLVIWDGRARMDITIPADKDGVIQCVVLVDAATHRFVARVMPDKSIKLISDAGSESFRAFKNTTPEIEKKTVSGIEITTFKDIVSNGADAEVLIDELAEIEVDAFRFNKTQQAHYKKEEFRKGLRRHSRIDQILVARDKERVLGLIALRKIQAGEAYMTDLAVKPACQSEGIGTLIMDKVIEWCRNNGIKTIVFASGVAKINGLAPSIGFHKKYFDRIGVKLEEISKVESSATVKCYVARLPDISGRDQPAPQVMGRMPAAFLRKIVDTEELARNIKEGILSELFSNKKLTLAFSKKLSGLDPSQLRLLVRQLNEWKESTVRNNRKMKILLDNFTVFEYDDLGQSLGERGIDANAQDAIILNYAPKPQDESEYSSSPGTAVKPVYIIEQTHAFPANYYYPLLEMVTVSLAKELQKWDAKELKDALAASNITVDIFGIDAALDENSQALIFKVLPKMERYDSNERMDRFAILMQLLRAA